MEDKNQPEARHKKHDFLIERIAFFSDAVFAIAITLIIIDIHPPIVLQGYTSAMVWQKLGEKIPQFFGLVVSFWLIGSAWLRHHQLFGSIDKYDIKFMIINLWLLFTIILFPFSTSFLFNSLFDSIVTKLQVFFYLAVPLASNFILYIMCGLVNSKHLEGPADSAFHKALFEQKFMVISFLLALTWMLILPLKYHPFGYIFLGLGPLISIIYRKRYKTKSTILAKEK
jgi:uncharacterized membrane protein